MTSRKSSCTRELRGPKGAETWRAAGRDDVEEAPEELEHIGDEPLEEQERCEVDSSHDGQAQEAMPPRLLRLSDSQTYIDIYIYIDIIYYIDI